MCEEFRCLDTDILVLLEYDGIVLLETLNLGVGCWLIEFSQMTYPFSVTDIFGLCC